MAFLQDASLILAPTGLAAAGAASAVAWYFQRAALRANQALKEGLARVKIRDEEVVHLATVRLPALAASPAPTDPAHAGPLLHPQLGATPFGMALQGLMKQTATLVGDVRHRAETAAHDQVQALLQPLAGMVNRQQSAMVQVLGTATDERVLAHAFTVDHTATLLSQRMDIIRVLLGEDVASGHPDLPLMTVLAGARSRVQDYTRVQTAAGREDAVRSRVAGPVAVALGELMENAARHSTPKSPVSVQVVEVEGGLCVVVDSIGPMLRQAEYQRAAALLPGQSRPRLTGLGGRLGFTAVGVLARQYGFQAWLDSSWGGGVRAVLHLPRHLLVRPLVADEPQQHRSPTDGAGTTAVRADAGQRLATFSRAARDAGQAPPQPGNPPARPGAQGAGWAADGREAR
ncbi:ATP-binding protein [Streptomyces sp. NPDC089795]|uniref:ATP-binding protein n=1 Tax=Streptomyces sp. NPDC089795 TaxID=3155297 RepID=UPI00342B9AC5